MPDGSAKRTGIALTERQRIAWLRLIRSDNVGPATFRDLINHCGSAENALAMLPELSARGGATRAIRIAGVQEAERELEAAHRFGARFVGIGEPDYPPALRQIEGAPPLLAMKGDLSAATRPSVGVVGSRNASISGAKFAAMIARDCGRAGYTVTSGLARGIDTAAHRASLETGTIAVLAGGLDQPYPPENIPLLEEITEGAGLAVSEMPFGWEPRARDFPRRNRLISGISLGVVVIEAAERSGSLITARIATDFGRLVFAVPGSPLDPRCHGTNGLLKQGAIVTTGSADVIEALAPLSQLDLFNQPMVEEPKEGGEMLPPNDDDRAVIVSALGPTPVDVDDIIRHTGLPASSVYLVLLELDLAARLHRHAGGMVSLAMED
ncbi:MULTISPECIES: DNA-processing protein DprA [Neorhizobium]|uniref:DNA protecting protein DprA n=1 Tax=Neorhizobium galegae bv. orientalis str. HAMBI 540 TaxID=1028800 RepID=A0A068SMD1_NEOGA|nr:MULTISPECIES: DNA-processing protein DprA [Neorhizobium]MCJ9672643.1 DNA-processing protein DprA [Neorhizobium sp. SHOUNA12B]MCJ9746197.1 DNA-processing protein DprA [Neorhizobium sp. SHOUNA12A]MCQ1854129.1 DNA-processing protein DprA [Neorhizobium galegae]CDN47427.1 DNA protecting protein DprA [Neorhizobium galegae bv. orientalis str. HAMBI 540]CDZ47653.1 DNA protecting protein DprA [Neorhizobium galegae bv. orientalis]